MSSNRLIIERVEEWIKSFQNRFFSFNKGYFNIHYISQSPESKIEGIKKSPFTKYNEEKQCFSLSTPLLKFKLKFIKFNEGFWLFTNHIVWKVNVKTISFCEEEDSPFYYLAFVRTSDNYSQKVITLKNTSLISPPSMNWSFFKANTKNEGYLKKNTRFFSVLFIVDKKWLQNYIDTHFASKINDFDAMLNQNEIISLPIPNAISVNKISNILNENLQNKPISEVNLPNAKELSEKIISCFLSDYLYFKNGNIEIKLKNNMIKKAENILEQSLYDEFIGIEKLAQTLSVSPTKLKSEFKKYNDKTVYQFYLEKQMLLASTLICQKVSVGEVATLLKYKDPNKFSIQFKKTFGVLPSKYL